MDFKGDIHTNGTPKSSQDSLLKKDNLALMGDPMDKIGGKKEEHSFISGLSVGQIGNQCPGPLGENGFGQTFKTDRFGLTQQGLNPNANINMNMGLPPFQSTKHPTMVESQMTSSLPYNEPPKPLLAPNKPSDANTHNIMDKPAEECSWTGQAMRTHSPNKAEQSLSEPLGYQGVPHKEATSDEWSDEAVQATKKKCETTEEAYSLLESLRSPEKTQSKSSNQEDSSRPDNGESWKSEIREWGGGRIQAKKSKTRMKLPEEWASKPDSGSHSVPPDPNTEMDIDVDVLFSEMNEAKDPHNIVDEQEGILPSFTATLQSAIPSTTSQENTIVLTKNPGLTQSPNLTSGLETTSHAISSHFADSKPFPNSSSLIGPSPSYHSSIVVSQNPADPASLTSHQEPPLAKSHQVKEDTTAKAKMEKIDPSPKADIMNTPENTEKADTKKVDNVSKIQETEKQDSKTEKSGKLEKTSNAEEIKKDMKEEKKNGGEKVDKTVKNEKNVKAAKETSKSTTPTGTKGLISPDKAKSSKQNSSKPNSHSTGQNTGAITSNSANKKGPVAKKTSPTGSKKPPGITSSHVAKTSENNTSAQRKPPVPKFNGVSTPKGSAGTKTSGSSVKPPQTKTPTNAASTAATDGAPRASRITKPPVPKQVPLSKKPPVPRAPRNTRISNTPMPDLKNVSSKIGSTDNMKYQPGGGKVQIVHKKMDFSHITSRCGSKDNIKHIPGGGNVQILNKKVDLSKVTSKCGSKDNLNHKPVGGNGKVESQKSKINSTAGSMDNVSQGPGGDHAEKAETQQKSEQSPPMKEKDLKETPTPTPASSEGQRLWNSPSQDKHIPATN